MDACLLIMDALMIDNWPKEVSSRLKTFLEIEMSCPGYSRNNDNTST